MLGKNNKNNLILIIRLYNTKTILVLVYNSQNKININLYFSFRT